MSVKVRIPTQLRPLAGGAGEVDVEGATVGEALKALDVAHPGFAERLFDESGNLRRFVNVFVGEEDIRFLDGLGYAGPVRRSRLGGAGGRRRLLAPAGALLRWRRRQFAREHPVALYS